MLRRLLLLLAALCCAGAGLAGEEPAVTVTKDGDTFIIDSSFSVPVSLRTAWEVFTDFEGMPSYLTNLKHSRVVSRDGNTWVVAQDGVAWYGPFRLSFQSEREMKLEPMSRLTGRALSGTAKRGNSEFRFSQPDPAQPVRIVYHSEVVPDSQLALVFGAPFLRHEVAEQFGKAIEEMERREGKRP